MQNRNKLSVLDSLLSNLTGLVGPRETKVGVSRDKSSIMLGDRALSSTHSPWEPLPNTKTFLVRPNENDPLLERFGISRKFSPDMKSEKLSWRITAANRYLSIQLAVLRNLKGQGRYIEFWIRALKLLKQSKVLRIVALRKLDSNFARKYNVSYIKTLFSTLNGMVMNLTHKYHLERVYIPKTKPDGTQTFRPLGVPSKAARLYLYLITSFMMIFLEGRIGQSQHAYQRGKGVITAWQELHKLLDRAVSIFEFDLKGFFPSLNTGYVVDILVKMGLPELLRNWLFELNLQYPAEKTLKEDKLNEDNARHKAELDAIGLLYTEPKEFKMKYVDKHGNYTGVVLAPIYEFIKANGEDLLIELMMEDLGYSRAEIKAHWFETLYEYYQVQAALFESFKPTPQYEAGTSSAKENPYNTILLEATKGFPQGSNMSPILSMVAFDVVLVKSYFGTLLDGIDFKIVAYADDFILLLFDYIHNWSRAYKWGLDGAKTGQEVLRRLATAASEFPNMESMGIVFNLEKSKVAKYNGDWLTDHIKFLGVTYDPELNTLNGTPRSGKDLLFTKQAAVETFFQREETLRIVAGELNFDCSINTILNGWGQGIAPFNKLPEGLIDGTITKDHPKFADLIRKLKLSINNPDVEEAEVMGVSGNFKKRVSHSWLDNESIAGFFMNRLHSGSWTPIEDLPGTDNFTLPMIIHEGKPIEDYGYKPRSFYPLKTKSNPTLQSSINMINLSSYAVFDLLSLDLQTGNWPKLGKFLHKSWPGGFPAKPFS